ncbi:MAG: EAL domain-containing protein [Sulfuricella denitrificans]|nr:EAL domain-containing protein [Sulfuricella denitrificans]
MKSLPADAGIPASALQMIEASVCTNSGRAVSHYRDVKLNSAFQPIFSLAHRRPVGYEALLRAYAPDGSAVPPPQVFDLAERHGEVTFLDRLCRTIHVRNYLNDSVNDNWIFLNINPEVVTDGRRHGSFFADFLEKYRIAPHRIVVEILENSISDEALLADAVGYYRDLGCLIAIDDFGAGHSNFDRIWRIAPQIVKLDRSMIARAAQQPKVRRLIPNLVSLIHESGSMALMEGIETEEEALIAMDSGIDFVQGYYFAKPGERVSHEIGCQDFMGGLCDRFKQFSAMEQQQYHLGLSPYLECFLEAARKIERGMSMKPASATLLEMPDAERCFTLDDEGRQIGDNALPARRSDIIDPRFAPLRDANGAIWSRRHYFRRAMAQPGGVQISRPYLSLAGASMCVTLSVTIRHAGKTCVFCCDVKWS